MGLFDDLFGNNKKKNAEEFGLFSFLENQQKEKKSTYSDKELDSYGLEDWQKEEIKKGNYSPWNFEEDEMEEDDYYFEDE